METKPHSADYFGETRDFWWNRDFLELMGKRWKLSAVKKALDVGCGVGHWGRCLAPLLPSGCELIGVDREARWVEEARKRAGGIPNVKASFQQGDAERLPFADGSFDLVTCQTVLIHVKDPAAVIREMLRVLIPGGLIALVEPNNIASCVSNSDILRPMSDVLSHLEFQMTCERGKMNFGEGFNSAGPFVAGWLSEIGVDNIESYTGDKTTMVLPPYTTPAQVAFIRETEELSQKKFWAWSEEDARRYFIAGGGHPTAFAGFWERALEREREFLAGVATGENRTVFAPVVLLISGRKKRG